MGQVKMKLKDLQQQPTNGAEQQQAQATTELNPNGPIIETCQKVSLVSLVSPPITVVRATNDSNDILTY